MLEAYKATPVFIPVDITEDVVELVAKKLSGSAGPGDTHLDALQGWLLKFGYTEKLCISVNYFVVWLANQNPLWDACGEFMSGRLIALYKLPGLRLVGFQEKWC